ncbi:unnamed protein product [Dicrocoelium dendriticum]|nr:unnamed protein product [Dicrocoelium dendriticum]
MNAAGRHSVFTHVGGGNDFKNPLSLLTRQAASFTSCSTVTASSHNHLGEMLPPPEVGVPKPSTCIVQIETDDVSANTSVSPTSCPSNSLCYATPYGKPPSVAGTMELFATLDVPSPEKHHFRLSDHASVTSVQIKPEGKFSQNIPITGPDNPETYWKQIDDLLFSNSLGNFGRCLANAVNDTHKHRVALQTTSDRIDVGQHPLSTGNCRYNSENCSVSFWAELHKVFMSQMKNRRNECSNEKVNRFRWDQSTISRYPTSKFIPFYRATSSHLRHQPNIPRPEASNPLLNGTAPLVGNGTKRKQIVDGISDRIPLVTSSRWLLRSSEIKLKGRGRRVNRKTEARVDSQLCQQIRRNRKEKLRRICSPFLQGTKEGPLDLRSPVVTHSRIDGARNGRPVTQSRNEVLRPLWPVEDAHRFCSIDFLKAHFNWLQQRRIVAGQLIKPALSESSLMFYLLMLVSLVMLQ